MDTRHTFNTELMEVIELGFLIDCSEATIAGALARKESRGGHYRADYQKRDDANFLKHTLAYHRAQRDPNCATSRSSSPSSSRKSANIRSSSRDEIAASTEVGKVYGNGFHER